MQTTQGNMLQSLRAVEAFIDANAATLTGVVSTGARQRLTGAIGELAAHVSTQTGSALTAQGSTKNQHLVREVLLRDHMAPLARIARADLPQTPQIAPLRMPRGRPTAPKLAAALRTIALATLTPLLERSSTDRVPCDGRARAHRAPARAPRPARSEYRCLFVDIATPSL